MTVILTVIAAFAGYWLWAWCAAAWGTFWAWIAVPLSVVGGLSLVLIVAAAITTVYNPPRPRK